MSGAWSQLEQLLTCAICLDRFRNPKLLPCQHTFCGEPCMEGLVDYARRQIKCPECRAEHRIPYNGVQSFPNNVTLARFLDLHRSITGEEPEPLPSQMDRCSVCGEKSYCNRCAHCEKKVCDECRTAHLDILRREINRINGQIRRGLEKLTEHAEQADKGSEKLLQITTQIRDEITESVRRIVKDLKDKESKLLEELDEFTVSETKNSGKLKQDFETELATITSNCELAEEHITDADEWTDVELMEYKDIFLKTLDFLRNLDPDSMDYSRKVKYVQKIDLDNLRRNAADFGEIKIIQPTANFNSSLSPSESTSNLSVPQSSLMRSQSDHRLAQFAARGAQRTDPLQRSYLDVTGQNRYGSDSERERGNSPPGRRGEVRYGSVHERSSRYGRDNNDFSYTRGWPRPGDSDYEPSNSANFRSRFMRERIRERTGNAADDDEHDSDVPTSHRVRFQEESPSRPKLFDTEEMANMRAPLSGLVKLVDSPHVMERLHQNEIKAKQKEAEAKENESNAAAAAPVTNPVPASTPVHRPARQISEDEIEKQKKQNQAAFSQSQANQTPTTTPTTPTTPTNNNAQSQMPKTTATRNSFDTTSTTATNRRIQAIQKEESRRSSPYSSDDNSESGDITFDDDISTPTPTSNSSARRRLYASTHTGSSGTGNNPSGSLNSSFSQSVDYETSSRNKYSTNSGNSNSSNNNSYQYQTSGHYFNPNASTAGSTAIARASISRYGHTEDSYFNNNAASAYIPYKNAKTAGNRINSDLDRGNATREEFIATSNYYGQFGRRNSVKRRNSDFSDDFNNNNNTNSSHNHLAIKPDSSIYSSSYSGTNYNDTRKSSNHYGPTNSILKNRLAKSKSSHSITYDDSDEDNPLSPSATSAFKSRFGIDSNVELGSDRLATRRTSRSGYTYRTREPSPEEESAGSVTQYLINKYGSRANRSTALSKSKSSHVIFGRSLSSSDEDSPNNNQFKYRRDSTDYSFKSTPIGLTYPRQLYLQKKRVMMKIGSRGTNPSCFTWPRGVACGPDNGIVVADSSNHRIQVFDSTGRFQFEFGSYGSSEGEFDCLAGVTVNRIGHFIVSDRYNHRVQVFDATGRFLRAFGSEGRSDGKFSYPWGIATDALGFIYVCDKENHRIQVFQSDGTFVGKFGTIGSRAGMLEHPHYIAVSNMNRIIVSDSNNHRIQMFDINGRSISTFGTEGCGDGQFKFPRGVAVDENGFIIVGDSGNNRIQIFNPDGTFLKAFGQWGSAEGEFKGLEGIAISSTGNILVCDRENHRIQVF